MRTVVQIQNAVVSNCAIDAEVEDSKYRTLKNLDHPYMAASLMIYFMLQNGYDVEAIKLELGSNNSFYDEASKWMKQVKKPEDEQRWIAKKQLVDNYLNINY